MWQLAKARQLDERKRPADVDMKVCQAPKHCQAGNRGRCLFRLYGPLGHPAQMLQLLQRTDALCNLYVSFPCHLKGELAEHRVRELGQHAACDLPDIHDQAVQLLQRAQRQRHAAQLAINCQRCERCQMRPGGLPDCQSGCG